MPEPPAQCIRSTIIYPELEKHTVESWLPMVTGHQETWVGGSQSNNSSTTIGISPTGRCGSQDVGTQQDSAHTAAQSAHEAQKDEYNASNDAILAQIHAGRARSHRLSSRSVWVNGTALMNAGRGMLHVRYETRRTVVAVRKKTLHHAIGSSTTSRHSSRQL